jgi:hypothetical protein
MQTIEGLEKLDKMAPQGAFSTFDAEVLVAEVEKLEPGQVYLEVGVDKGKSLHIARAVAKKGVKVFGVDLNIDPKIPGTTFLQGDSKLISQGWNIPIDVLFIDGDHSYLGCKIDIESWFPHVKEGGVMLFHDCDESSPGVVQAVAEFVNNFKGRLNSWQLFKRTDKNTSISKIQL